MADVKYVVGLGNPGRRYATTRHNAGWWLIDALDGAWGLGGFREQRDVATATGRVEPHAVRLIKPLTYMNLSGAAVRPLRKAGVDVSRDLLVLVDDVALEPGRARFRPSGSSGGHNGLRSVEQTLGTRDYPRLRIGVGAKPPGWDLSDWVLGRPAPEDRDAILSLLPDLVDGVRTWMDDGIEAAMNRFNR